MIATVMLSLSPSASLRTLSSGLQLLLMNNRLRPMKLHSITTPVPESGIHVFIDSTLGVPIVNERSNLVVY
jgi:hypothetical protein